MDESSLPDLSTVLADVIADALSSGDSVALPSFGTLSAVKNDERTVTTPEGSTLLMPPAITVQFTPALKLVKQVKEGGRS